MLLLPSPTPRTPVSSSGLSTSVESTQAEIRQARLASSDIPVAVAVYSAADGRALSKAQLAQVNGAVALVSDLVVTPSDGQSFEPQVSQDGTVALVVLPLEVADDDEAVTQAVSELRSRLRSPLSAATGDAGTTANGLEVQVTGPAGLTADLSAVFDGADATLLFTTLGVVALLLVVTYRSPFLWLVPLAVVGAAEQTSLKLIEQVLPRVGLAGDAAVTGITSVLVFGAATDYALLLIARYREQLRATGDRFAAMRQAVAATGGAITASAATVTLTVATLLLSAIEGTRALGLAAAIGICVSLVAALLVLPAALLVCGRGVFWPRVPQPGTIVPPSRYWNRLGALVSARPRAIAGVGSVALVGVALLGLGASTGLSQNEQFRVQPESIAGAKTLATAFPPGITDPVAVIADAGSAGQVAATAEDLDGVASAGIAEISNDQAQVDVVLTAEPGTEASYETIRALRTALDAVPAADAVVGGDTATSLDVAEAQSRDRRLIIPLILALVAGVLVLLLRSLVAPVVLVASVVASYFASLGISRWLFDHLLGIPALDVGVLLLSFVFLVALGVDYNIFLVTRAREETPKGGTRRAILTALAVTGGVITSAGILLAAVFAVLGVLPLIVLTQIGVIVCVGVLLDTLLVRTVVVPAAVVILGDRFWWPRHPSPYDASTG